MDPHLHQRNSIKRKRDLSDQNGNRKQMAQWSQPSNNIHGNGHSANPTENFLNPTANSLDFSQHIEQHLANASPSTRAHAIVAGMPQLTVPQPTELSFPGSGSGNDGDRPIDSSFEMGGGSDGDQTSRVQGAPYNLDMYQADPGPEAHSTREHDGGGTKPTVGSDEWHKVRRDNHKEVERRRRETINEGINELAKIVPNCEKNKGSILQRGVQYIAQLKDNETRNIEKWTLEKLLTDQAIAELSSSVDRLKDERDHAYREAERWKKICQDAGLNTRENDASGSEDDEN